jgi:hypothetical protein
LCWCWCNRAGEGKTGRTGRTGKAGRACTRQAQDQAAHAAWYTLSLPTHRARMTRLACACGRTKREARVQACRRAGVWACGRMGVWACVGSPGKPETRPAQRQMRDETTRQRETELLARRRVVWPTGRDKDQPTTTTTTITTTRTNAHQPAAASQRRHSSSDRNRTRNANRSAAAGYKRPLGPGGISAVPTCFVPGPGCRTCHLLAMPS